jgi:hypothetical protein
MEAEPLHLLQPINSRPATGSGGILSSMFEACHSIDRSLFDPNHGRINSNNPNPITGHVKEFYREI